MHSKIIKHLQDLKEELKGNCEKCKGKGCLSCSKAYDLYERMAQSRIPLRYWKFDLADLKDEIPGVSEIRKYISKLDMAYKEGQGVFAYGKNGNGKTLCACLIGKEAIKKGYSVRFAFLGEIISSFIDSMYDSSRREQIQKDILEIDFLILDDMDKTFISKDSKYIDSILDSLFRVRVQNCLPVIMTANKTMGDILASQEVVSSKSLLSLFDESLIPILFMGCDHRAELKKDVRKRYLDE